MAKVLYKYDGPVVDLNGRVRSQYCEYAHAYSKDQALVFLKRKYLQKYGLTYRAGVKLKLNYLKEVS